MAIPVSREVLEYALKLVKEKLNKAEEAVHINNYQPIGGEEPREYQRRLSKKIHLNAEVMELRRYRYNLEDALR